MSFRRPAAATRVLTISLVVAAVAVLAHADSRLLFGALAVACLLGAWREVSISLHRLRKLPFWTMLVAAGVLFTYGGVWNVQRLLADHPGTVGVVAVFGCSALGLAFICGLVRKPSTKFSSVNQPGQKR